MQHIMKLLCVQRSWLTPVRYREQSSYYHVEKAKRRHKHIRQALQFLDQSLALD